MKRRLFNILSVLSLLLCVMLVVLWVRESWRIDWWRWGSGAHTYQLMHDGDLHLMKVGAASHGEGVHWGSADRSQSNKSYAVYVGKVVIHDFWIGKLHRGVGRFSSAPQGAPDKPFWWVSIGGWYLLLVVSVPWLLRATAVAARWRLRAGRTRMGLCPSCGYDLRATPDRCPECGTARPAAEVTA